LYRPDIAHVVGVVSRFLSNPGIEHWKVVKWILRYLRGTSNLKLCFGIRKPVLCGYTDSDMAGDVNSRKSTSSYLITFAGRAVAWQSRLQKCVALSTTEAEFIATTEACKELLWMKKFVQELVFQQRRYVLFCDSQSIFILARILLFMVDLNILMYGIIGSVIFLTLNYWSLRRFIQMTMVQI